MYSTGTVTTTANSTKLVGAGTKWLNNINRVSAEQAIQIQIGTTVHNNSIQSIQSDTELTLNFPIPTAATGAKYVILTTMVHSVSDAMNKIVSMNVSNVQFSDILTRWMTEQGIITVTLPDQTTQQLRTTKEMDKQLDGKLDKAGGAVKGNINAEGGLITAIKDNTFVQLKATDAGKPALLSSPDNKKFNTHSLQNSSGVIMHIGDYGFGGSDEMTLNLEPNDASTLLAYLRNKSTPTSIFKTNTFDSSLNFKFCPIAYFKAGNTFTAITAGHLGQGVKIIGGYTDGHKAYNVYTDVNTTKDAQGNLRAASPIIKVFADHIETNDESEGVTLEKLGVGRYKIKGVLGMNSDASWGGFNGGIVIPKGINGLELVWADYKVLADGDIILETHYRKHADLPPPVVLNRLIAYPEFMDENGNELESYTPCDIPNGHWIDIRVQMPSNSIYNQKQAEAERLAKLEAERLAQEEAKRAVEEAERVEQEAADRKQYGLDDNSVLL
ncbi:hypothetical protein NTP67_08295 [Providencia rettgeri]|uniref:phage tail fiber protein n=1 Tax=Providencia rettgeri TaxID=587 RepID=UPI00222104C1|nr:hypothetical protein [Providencia rettgeri]ELR5278866.1 hypothetical protein [Providencia rettgeri]UYV43233.1 hypothetical protein NTP67_08295 [Providencia rettgeri]